MSLDPAHRQRLRALADALNHDAPNRYPQFDVDAMWELDALGWTPAKAYVLADFLSRYDGTWYLGPDQAEQWMREHDYETGEVMDSASHQDPNEGTEPEW